MSQASGLHLIGYRVFSVWYTEPFTCDRSEKGSAFLANPHSDFSHLTVHEVQPLDYPTEAITHAFRKADSRIRGSNDRLTSDAKG